MPNITLDVLKAISAWADEQYARKRWIESLSYQADVEDSISEGDGHNPVSWILEEINKGRLIYGVSKKKLQQRLDIKLLEEIRNDAHKNGAVVIGPRPAAKKYYAPIPGTEQ